MTVYVDALFSTVPCKRWPYRHACHLTADTFDELHRFARQQLGLQHAWYQPHPGTPALCHYDLTATKRAQAIRRGARVLTGAQLAARIAQARTPQR